MKKIIIFATLLLWNFVSSQTNAELKKDIEEVKTKVSTLEREIQTVKSQNIYFKSVLDINKPILEQSVDNNEYRITNVIGNKNERTISINMLIEAKNENKTSLLQNFSLIDLLGNQYEIDFFKSSDTNPKLTLNVPLNLKITFKNIVDEPKVIKLFKFTSRNEPEKISYEFTKSIQEFRDINVTWE
ncbi:transposase [Riemerella anatipestifer]|nr:transposase [Riemerella anatipestifer]